MARARTSNAAAVRLIELEVTLEAPLARVWKALVEQTGAWWPRDFYTAADARDFVIEAWLGGRMYEDWGKGEGVIWASVTAVRAPRMLELAGVSSPAWGGPNTHYHSFRLEEKGGATLLSFCDAVHGRIDDATARSLKEGWTVLFDEALRAHCEKRKAPAKRKR